MFGAKVKAELNSDQVKMEDKNHLPLTKAMIQETEP